MSTLSGGESAERTSVARPAFSQGPQTGVLPSHLLFLGEDEICGVVPRAAWRTFSCSGCRLALRKCLGLMGRWSHQV